MNRRLGLCAALVLGLLAAGPAFAGELTVTGAWARTTPPGAKMGAIYLVIDNGSKKSDRLLKLRLPSLQARRCTARKCSTASRACGKSRCCTSALASASSSSPAGIT